MGTMSSVADLVYRFESGKKDWRAPELGVSIVGIGAKRTPQYVGYINSAIKRRITMFHLLARGYARIAKAQLITKRLVEEGQVNVYRCDHDKYLWQGAEVPYMVVTLISSKMLARTSEDIWSPSHAGLWLERAAEHRRSLAESSPSSTA